MTCEIWVAVRKGLEPSTSGVTGRHSNQLNYRTRLVASLSKAVAKIDIILKPAMDGMNFLKKTSCVHVRVEIDGEMHYLCMIRINTT